ncbi:sulfurtransferase-like selenium metabolism protein YedF [Desulfobacula toluolica]|uniref:SirA family protein n=1 Tax=Desulfobacula toluolica (strain DSM 7467 / Tol2) TaxID=651182 RepID=K0NG34_DESTT|nr:sulfurtransferase-like selenium metabolism protein YedF [Desulfobacula toluolica]CCK78743.1 SirA family protein [Desulfobacula toluolica Tol2]
MIKKIDCRQLQCPAPVLNTKKFLEQEPATEIDVIVDNDAAVENVSRFLSFHGFEVSVDTDGINSTISGRRDPETATILETNLDHTKTTQNSDTQKILVIISSQQIGKGDDELGQKLMINFVKTLKEMGNDLWRLILLNGGVKFSTKDSKIFEDLAGLDASGVSILVCGACLTHFGLMDAKVIGETTNMLDVVTSMQLADKVINI